MSGSHPASNNILENSKKRRMSNICPQHSLLKLSQLQARLGRTDLAVSRIDLWLPKIRPPRNLQSSLGPSSSAGSRALSIKAMAPLVLVMLGNQSAIKDPGVTRTSERR